MGEAPMSGGQWVRVGGGRHDSVTGRWAMEELATKTLSHHRDRV